MNFHLLKFWMFFFEGWRLSSCKFFSILDHQTLDPDPVSGSAIRKNYGSGAVSGSALNQCGSETLPYTILSFL